MLERKYGVPEIVNDGVTIARDIELADPEQNVGVKLVQEVATKSDMKAGDGTTTSTVMTQAIVNQGMRQVTAGANPVALRRGIQFTAKILTDTIREMAKPVENNKDLFDIATVATGGNAEMGKVIAKAFEVLCFWKINPISRARALSSPPFYSTIPLLLLLHITYSWSATVARPSLKNRRRYKTK